MPATPPDVHGAAPELGQHNREVYLDWLGIEPARYDALRSAGVI